MTDAMPSDRKAPGLTEKLAERLRARARAALERVVTSPVIRWTWNDLGDTEYDTALGDFRPADTDSIREMMAGRYLLAGKLIDTHGVSPFSIAPSNPDWIAELQNFSWLRHFRDARDPAERGFARTLTLDWIGRYRSFDPITWRPDLTAQRVMNWLRHLDLLVEEATPAQLRTLNRVLNQQVQSLRVRAGLVRDPLDALMARIALLGAALAEVSNNKTAETVAARLDQLHQMLDTQIDPDGLHLSRNPAAQTQILTELVTLRQALAKHQTADRLGALIERMHSVIAQLTMGTGELAYFNGAGQQPADLLYALRAQSNAPRSQSSVLSGYGILRSGQAVVVADNGRVPPPALAGKTHAGALSFEFSHGRELIVGNCGPAPAELPDADDLFRLGPAHSGPMIGSKSSAVLNENGILTALDPSPLIETDTGEVALHMRTRAFVLRSGAVAERWITLISDGDTLVGKDRFSAMAGASLAKTRVTLRFHLGPGVKASRMSGENIIRLRLPSGTHWSFLWEGATAGLDESVRQSAVFGFRRTRQIVLTAPLTQGAELVWILTRQS